MADTGGKVRVFLRLPLRRMKVLITAPSLDENRNVSGISTVVRQIIEYGMSEFVHFEAGRQDGDGNKVLWFVRQIMLPLRFLQRIRSSSPDVVHINTAMTILAVCRDAVLVRCARFAGRPVVLSIHGGKYLVEPFANRFYERTAGRMLRHSRFVVVLSEIEKQVLSERWPGLNIVVLPNAVPTDAATERSRNNNEPAVIVFLGRMHESKGLGEIGEALVIMTAKDARFLFKAYGDGPMRDSFVLEMKRSLGESFEYGGIVRGEEKWKKLAAADIFVLPSRYGEGLPMAMLEAMAAGCLVVASDNASITSVLSNGYNGYIVESRNGRQLAETLTRLLSDREGWKSVQQAAVATVRDKFSIESYIAKLDSIYDAVAKKI